MICLGRDIHRVEDVFRCFAGPSLYCVYVPEDVQFFLTLNVGSYLGYEVRLD